MVCLSTPSRVGMFQPANEVVCQAPEPKLEVLVPMMTKATTAMMTTRAARPALIAKMIQPVLDFLREPTGSVPLDVSAMMPKMRLGIPTEKKEPTIDTPDTMVKMIADVLLGTLEAPGA